MAEHEGARKAGKFMAICTTPDVCKTPVGNTVVPIPYPITSNLNDSTSTSTNVNFGGDPAYVHDKSKISKVTGDEPGTAGGVKSGTNRSMVETIKGSSTVNVNKKPVVRHTDPCKMNNGNTMGKVIYQGVSKNASGISSVTNPPAKPETPQEEKAKEEKKGLWSKLSDGVHTALDVAGFIPGLGAIPDILNAGIYAAEGNVAMAALSVVAAVPGVGDGVKAGTMVVKGGKAIAKQAAKKTAKKLTKEAAEKGEKELVKKGVKEKAKKEAAEKTAKETSEAASKKKGENGFTVKGQSICKKKIDYKKRDREEYKKLRKEFDQKERKKFLQDVANDPEKAAQLKKAGLSDIDIANMKKGIPPDGYQVHHKLPLDDGGTNSFDNLILIKNDPHHISITNTQRSLTNGMKVGETRKINFPIPDGFVYPK